MKFFNPTTELKELLLLQHIEANEDTTQKAIGKIIDGAPSMVNLYIYELEQRGYLLRDYKSAKIVYYRITPEGIKRKNYLLISYMRGLLDIYQLAKNSVAKFLIDLENKSYNNILLYGAGEVAEIIIGVKRDGDSANLNILAIIDDDTAKQGKEILGYKIISSKEISIYKHDAIVITSYTFEDDIKDKLREIEYPMDKVERFFGL